MKPPILSLLLGLSLCGIGGAMMYVYLKNRNDEEEENNEDSKSKIKEEIKLEMTITNEIAPILVGRNSFNLYSIEERTRTSIKFREKDDDHQICEIRGSPEAVKVAQELIKQTIKRADSVTVEVEVPSTACGKIMGRCGDSLQEICRKSKAKVSVLPGEGRHAPTRRVLIVGNQIQVNTAKLLIDEKVKEDSEARKLLNEVELKREPRGGVRTPTSLTPASSRESLPPKPERLNPTSSDGQLEVYVSAVASPARFWLQLVGPQSSELDVLVSTMTDYYGKTENQEFHKIREPYLGQIVAAMFKFDSKWYRAEVISILPNDYRPGEVVLDLYFVDYGDSEYVGTYEVCELRTDFLRLRFQAIECYLAHVRPALTNDPDIWDEQSICRFEELTHVAQWKKMLSRIVTYKERTKGDTRIRREGSPVPGIELYDLNEGNDINVANELISEGLATISLDTSELTKDSLEMLSSGSEYGGVSGISGDTSQSTSFHEILTNNVNNTLTIPGGGVNIINNFLETHNNDNNNTNIIKNGKILMTNINDSYLPESQQYHQPQQNNDKFSAIVENTTNENYENIQKDVVVNPFNSTNLLLDSERMNNGNVRFNGSGSGDGNNIQNNHNVRGGGDNNDRKPIVMRDWNEIIEEEMREKR